VTTITPANALSWRKTASGQALYLRDRGKALATVEPDATYPSMWRVRMPDGRLSDMARLEWAKEGALTIILRDLNSKETAPGAARTCFPASEAA
jgi:hypothetical protein